MNQLSLSNTALVQNCGFDFVQTIEIVPENSRDSFFGKATVKATDKINVFVEAAYSRLDLTARIAPNTASVAIAKGSPLYTTYVRPYLTAAQDLDIKSVTASYRTFDWGTRDSETITTSKNLVLGAEGDIGSWSFGTGLTWSRNAIDERYVGGYVKNTEFRDMLAKNQFDPVPGHWRPVGCHQEADRQLGVQRLDPRRLDHPEGHRRACFARTVPAASRRCANRAGRRLPQLPLPAVPARHQFGHLRLQRIASLRHGA
jgi:iron complex outermembrane receptor protein